MQIYHGGVLEIVSKYIATKNQRNNKGRISHTSKILDFGHFKHYSATIFIHMLLLSYILAD